MNAEKINSTEELRHYIAHLEEKQREEAKRIREDFDRLYESLRPINILTNTLGRVNAISAHHPNIIDHTIGAATGYLSKKAFSTIASSAVNKMLGGTLQLVVSNYISNHPERIKSVVVKGAQWILKKITEKKAQKRKQEALYFDIE